MKTFFRLSTLLLLVIFYSCSKEELTDTENIENEKHFIGNKAFDAGQNEEELALENKKQWIAYLAVKALQDNSESKLEFVNAIGNKGVIGLEQLFNSANISFRQTFREQFYRFYNNSSEDCVFNSSRPEDRPAPGDVPGGTDVFGAYLYEIYNLDLEFYLPNNFNLLVSTITSSADSLSQINDAYMHESECLVYHNFGFNGFQQNIVIVR